MNAPRHLTEAERHDAADGTMAADQRADVNAHLEHCEECANDVARVRTLMTRLREAPAPAHNGADLWPEIRSRIEREKIVQLPAADAPRAASPRTKWWLLIAGGVAAALLLIVALPQMRQRGKAVQPTAAVTVELQLVADSARAYEREATILLNELELRRAMLPPHRRATLDRDLKIIDGAILELKEAIARDPNNPALRRLLASSYKQKVDLLKRVGA